MKIQHNNVDMKRLSGQLSIIPESQDDIYELEAIIDIGDKVKSHTQRKIQLDNKNQIKMNLILKIKIESIHVDLEGCIIYLKGRTCEENEYVKLGSYHTIEVELEKKFNLEKGIWTHNQLNTLKESTKSKQDILFIILYEKECVVSKVGKNRITIKNKIEIKNKKFTNIINTLTNYVQDVEMVVIASISEVRNDIYKAMKSHKDFKTYESIFIVKLPAEMKKSSNSKIINFILTDTSTSSQFRSIRYVEDLKEVNKFFVLFEMSSELACVGRNNIDEAFEYGALDSIFMNDELYRPNTVEKRKEIEEFCASVEVYRIKFFVIPVSHYLGERLKDLGGLVGILKFNYK